MQQNCELTERLEQNWSKTLELKVIKIHQIYIGHKRRVGVGRRSSTNQIQWSPSLVQASMQIGKKETVDFTPIPLIISRAFDASHSVRRTSFSSACNALLLLRFRNRIGRLSGQVDQRFGDSERSLRRGMTLEFLRVCLCVRENEKETPKNFVKF